MPKDEDLKPDEFICKCCWKKVKSSVKYEIFGHLFFNEDNGWQQSKTKFTVCFECFNEMLAFIDDKATEIVGRLGNELELRCPEDKAALHRFKVYVENRYKALDELLGKLNHRLGLKGRTREKKIEEKSKEAKSATESLQEKEGSPEEEA